MTYYEHTWNTSAAVVESLIDDDYNDLYGPLEIPDLSPNHTDLVQQRMVILVTFVVIAVAAFGLFVVARWQLSELGEEVELTDLEMTNAVGLVEPEVAVNGRISPIFSREVKYWEREILQWSAERDLDPNMAATIMQIESCGDMGAISHAGAQGLFQVMPFHFTPGENTLDPHTNARRGLDFFVEQLGRFGDVNLAFAAYNGGPGNAVKRFEEWPHETQRYYYWSQGIYADAQAGLTTSTRLQEWMEAGGASLCNQAAARLGIQ
ncbi:MAG: lytic transglycosylase domain-containing protein [Ardenticatenaceae bacterium]|nr:lytic transglycosylase domain-containing protein [Ardenticatenaceae bacterium]